MAVDRFGQHYYPPEELLDSRRPAATYLASWALALLGGLLCALGSLLQLSSLEIVGVAMFFPAALASNQRG